MLETDEGQEYFIHETDLIKFYKEFLIGKIHDAKKQGKPNIEFLNKPYEVAVLIIQEYFQNIGSPRVLRTLEECFSQGSVVSKTLVNQKMGTLTLFAFDQDQGLSEHTARFDTVVQILDGKEKLTIGGKVITALIGQMVLMPAVVPHALKAVEKFKMLLTMIRS